jgi:hypothetical protein
MHNKRRSSHDQDDCQKSDPGRTPAIAYSGGSRGSPHTLIDRVPKLGERTAYAQQAIREKLIDHKQYIAEHGDDMPNISGWRWGSRQGFGAWPRTSTEGDNV